MIGIVYFSHSYRPADAEITDYFARLLDSEGLLPSLDPPSPDVNSAKLERHLAHSDGVVAILTERDDGTSPHVSYEIALSVRSRKPLLVFVEDTLPDDLVPPRILQRRFSRRSFFREAREHRHAVSVLRDYIGAQPPPRYQALSVGRTCVLLGLSRLDRPRAEAVTDYVRAIRRYRVLAGAELRRDLDRYPVAFDALANVDVAVAVLGQRPSAYDQYALGVLQGLCRPLIRLRIDPGYRPVSGVPTDYQARPVPVDSGPAEMTALLAREFDLYEEEFLQLVDQRGVDRYMRILVDLGGRYGERTRNDVMEVVMGDRYDVHGQAGAVGPDAHVHDVTFSQLWQRLGGQVDLDALAGELATLRAALRRHAGTPEEDLAVAHLGRAEIAARRGEGPAVMRHLRDVGHDLGRWVLDVAAGIGVPVAVAAIRSATGV